MNIFFYSVCRINATQHIFFYQNFAHQINEKEEKMKADSITSPIRKQGFRASMTVKW